MSNPTTHPAVTCCIFDWGGTLTPWHSIDVRASWQAAVGDIGLAARLARAEEAAWARSRDHQRSAALADVFAAAGITPTEQMLADYHAWWAPHTYTDPDVATLWEQLHAGGIKVGVLSNTLWPRELHESIFRRDGVLELIDGAVYTSEVPWTKPHPAAFRAALDAVGVADAGSAVFIGDRLFDDIHGAAAAGLRTVHVPHSTIPEHQVGAVLGEPDAVIDRLAELTDVLDRWAPA